MQFPFPAAVQLTPEQIREEVKRRWGMDKLTATDQKSSVNQEIAGRGLLIHPTFASFVQAHRPDMYEHDYVRRQIAVAQRVIDHEILRVMVLLTTQYGKSTIWSQLLPAYYLLRHPARMVALSSYGADLAWSMSGEARDFYAASGGRFRVGSPRGSTRNWRTERSQGASGGMWATGIGGPSLGRGYNLGIVDDPVDPEQATRKAYQQRFARWWPSKWLRGQRAGGAPIVFVMQRLGLDDPVEWLLSREEGKTAEHWHIIVMDEIRSSEPFSRYKGTLGFPETCTVEPDPRPMGEVLAPKFRSVKEVEKLQAEAGPIYASSMRQQRPMRPTGEFWQAQWFRKYDVLPTDAFNGGWDWDTAYTKDEANSATAGVKSYRGPGKDTFDIYIDDVFWDWLEFPELITRMLEVDGPHYVEKKASGKSAAQVLRTYDIPVEEVPVSGDKLSRAAAFQPAVQVGRVYVRKAIWDLLMFGEHQGLLRVTAEALQGEAKEGLDLNDAFTQSGHRHLGLSGEQKKRRKVSFV